MEKIIIKKYWFLMIMPVIFCFGCAQQNFHFTTSIDEFSGQITTSMKNMNSLYFIDGTYALLHYLAADKIIMENGNIFYSLIYYKSCKDKLLFPQKIIIIIDSKKYNYEFFDTKTKSDFMGNNYDCEEIAWVYVDPSIFEEISNAQEVKFRVIGTNESIDYKFNEWYFYYYKRFFSEIVNGNLITY